MGELNLCAFSGIFRRNSRKRPAFVRIKKSHFYQYPSIKFAQSKLEKPEKVFRTPNLNSVRAIFRSNRKLDLSQ